MAGPTVALATRLGFYIKRAVEKMFINKTAYCQRYSAEGWHVFSLAVAAVGPWFRASQ